MNIDCKLISMSVAFGTRADVVRFDFSVFEDNTGLDGQCRPKETDALTPGDSSKEGPTLASNCSRISSDGDIGEGTDFTIQPSSVPMPGWDQGQAASPLEYKPADTTGQAGKSYPGSPNAIGDSLGGRNPSGQSRYSC